MAKTAGKRPIPLPSFDEFQLRGSLCKRSFSDFLRQFWHVVVQEKLLWNWHLEFLCDELQELAERVFAGQKKKHDLIINISPGTSKSTIASIMFPAWCWTRMASCRIISASYQYNLATNLSRKSRDVIKSELYQKCFPGIDIRDDQDSKGFFVNSKGGERYAIGVDGGVMGQHAHIIIVDDPLDPKQAASDADLATANRWMEETLPSRKVDKNLTPTILIMQRLHEFDPTGARLEKGKKVAVRHICLPAELTDNVKPVKCRDYYIDGLMDTTRLNYDALAEAEAQGDFVYASQYLQTPIPRGGAMFHVAKIGIGTPAKITRRVRYWDKASSQGSGTYTVGVLMGIDVENRYWVLDVVRGQWDSGRRENIMRQTAKKDGLGTVIWLEQEPGGGGKDSALGSVRGLAGYRVRPDKVGKSDGDKEARADAFSVQMNIGNVSMLKATWNEEYINELKYFPRSRYKDQVDASSGAFNKLAMARIVLGGTNAIINQQMSSQRDERHDPEKSKRRTRITVSS
jgi:predicted phage terminase large subunit-like protein